jgi:hypothetical protein
MKNIQWFNRHFKNDDYKIFFNTFTGVEPTRKEVKYEESNG